MRVAQSPIKTLRSSFSKIGGSQTNEACCRGSDSSMIGGDIPTYVGKLLRGPHADLGGRSEGSKGVAQCEEVDNGDPNEALARADLHSSSNAPLFLLGTFLAMSVWMITSLAWITRKSAKRKKEKGEKRGRLMGEGCLAPKMTEIKTLSADTWDTYGTI